MKMPNFASLYQAGMGRRSMASHVGANDDGAAGAIRVAARASGVRAQRRRRSRLSIGLMDILSVPGRFTRWERRCLQRCEKELKRPPVVATHVSDARV